MYVYHGEADEVINIEFRMIIIVKDYLCYLMMTVFQYYVNKL